MRPPRPERTSWAWGVRIVPEWPGGIWGRGGVLLPEDGAAVAGVGEEEVVFVSGVAVASAGAFGGDDEDGGVGEPLIVLLFADYVALGILFCFAA